MSWFEAFNSVSFIFLSGNIITLYVLKLGADNFLIGLLASFTSIAFFFMPAGRQMVGWFSLKKVMGTFWLFRYLVMIPVIFSPFLVSRGLARTALLLITLSNLGFHVCRGVGIVGFNPYLGIFTDRKTRGEFLAKLQIIFHSGSIIGGVLIALLLGSEAPLERYTIFIAVGIFLGIIGSILVFRFPDPPEDTGIKGSGFFSSFRTAIKNKPFYRFVVHFLILSFIVGMAIPFIVVYPKQVYGVTDSLVILLTVVGSLGAIFMGLVSRLLMDRIGAKPLYLLFALLFFLSMAPITISFTFSFPILILYLTIIFFVFHLGHAGIQNAAQNYFFACTEPADHLNLGIVYQLAMGAGTAAGSFLGGALLRWLETWGSSHATDLYRMYYGLILLLLFMSIITITLLKDVGKYSIRNGLSIIFSPRDFRAMVLLKRLSKSRNVTEELSALDALAESRSEVPVDEILQRLESPLFRIRSRALETLEDLPADRKVVKVLIREVKNHPFTTAYMAAQIIGRKQISEGEKVLRHALFSRDYLLQAKSMFALARLGSWESVPLIEEILDKTKNPLVIMHGAAALELLKSRESIPVLIRVLRKKDPHPFLRDEIILAISGILEMEEWFYPFYELFLQNRKEGVSELFDWFEERLTPDEKNRYHRLRMAIGRMLRKRDEFAAAAAGFFHENMEDDRIDRNYFAEISLDPELRKFERVLFLIAAVTVRLIITDPRYGKIRKRMKGITKDKKLNQKPGNKNTENASRGNLGIGVPQKGFKYRRLKPLLDQFGKFPAHLIKKFRVFPRRPPYSGGIMDDDPGENSGYGE